MRRAVAVTILCSLALLAVAAPAAAQVRDPFRPPAGASSGGGEVSQPPPTGDGDVTPPDSGGLPRTGQDLLLLVAMAVAFMAAGGALRLTGRALAT